MASVELDFSHGVACFVGELTVEKEFDFFSLDALSHGHDAIGLHKGLDVGDVHLLDVLRLHLASDLASLLDLHPSSLEGFRTEITCRSERHWFDDWFLWLSSSEAQAIKSTCFRLFRLLLRLST